MGRMLLVDMAAGKNNPQNVEAIAQAEAVYVEMIGTITSGTAVLQTSGDQTDWETATDRDGAVIGFSSNSKKKILIPRGNYFVRILTTGVTSADLKVYIQ